VSTVIEPRLTNCHRLLLRRSWLGIGGFVNCRIVNWIMLNPSTADDVVDDPTIRKCVGFSKRWGFSGLVVTNLFTFRATDPKDLMKLAKVDFARAVGLADSVLIEQAKNSDLVVAAWGNHGNLYGRADDVCDRVLTNHRLYCIGLTSRGMPLHPVMAAYVNSPMKYR
jgi:hypothetical protein